MDSLDQDVATVRAFVERAMRDSGTVYMGIDTGAQGAIALIRNTDAIVVDIPVFKLAVKRTKKVTKKEREETGNKAKTKRVDGTTTVMNNLGIIEMFKALRPLQKGDPGRVQVCLEIAQIMVKGKGASAYTAAKVFGFYAAFPLFLASKGFSVCEISPNVWKRAAGLWGKDKNFVRKKAQALWPTAPLCRVEDHNRAEALLLAEYFRREREGNRG